MDDYEPLMRRQKYSVIGTALGFIGGIAGGVFLGEYMAQDYSAVARVSLDIVLGAICSAPGAVVGVAGGMVISDLVNIVLRLTENTNHNKKN